MLNYPYKSKFVDGFIMMTEDINHVTLGLQQKQLRKFSFRFKTRKEICTYTDTVEKKNTSIVKYNRKTTTLKVSSSITWSQPHLFIEADAGFK